MLQKDIPALFLIGTGYWDSSSRRKVYFYKQSNNIMNDVNVNTYEIVKKNDGTDYYIAEHWMTITELRIDILNGQRWLKVQTWGEYKYINFDEWIENQLGTFWDLLMVINKDN